VGRAWRSTEGFVARRRMSHFAPPPCLRSSPRDACTIIRPPCCALLLLLLPCSSSLVSLFHQFNVKVSILTQHTGRYMPPAARGKGLLRGPAAFTAP
jgi:hypothetical protein